VVFVEENIPFQIIVQPDSGQLTLPWGERPTFGLEGTAGHLALR
jgi:hypothetical protein